MKGKTPFWTIFAVFITTLLIAVAQVFWKQGANKLTFDLVSLISNWQIWLGFVIYGVGAVILIVSLKYGELSTLYPVIALGYVWVSILASKYFGEEMNFIKWGGIVFIILGVILIGRGSEKNDLEAYTEII